MDQIDAIIAGLESHAEAICVELTLEVTALLQETTPIHLGWARAGWVPTIGSPYQGGGDLKPDPAKVVVAMARQADAKVEVAAFKITDGDLFVTNNVRYIQVLNDGHSKQAPAGFVQAAVAQAVQTVKARNQ